MALARFQSNEPDRFCYATSRWDALLYDARRFDGGSLASAETEVRNAVYTGRVDRDFARAESEAQTFGREVFARLYSSVGRIEDGDGPSWVARAHDLIGQVDGFESLRMEIDGDPDLAALAAASMMSSVSGSLEDLVEDDGDCDSAGLPSAGDRVRAALRSAVKTARRAVGEAREGLAGLAPGLGSTPAVQDQDGSDRMRLAERLRSDARLRDLIQRAGRMQRIASAERSSVTEGVEEIFDVTRGNDVARLLPAEISKVAHPAMRALLLRDLAQRSAMVYALRSNEPMGRGPVIGLLDISTSMSGEPHRWTRAVGLALVGTAQREKRTSVVADFNGGIARARKFDRSGEVSDLLSGRRFDSLVDGLMDIASTGVSGGTSFDRALRWSLDQVEGGGSDLDRADLVIVTDGCDSVSAEVVERLSTLRDRTGLRLFALTINGGAIDSNLAAVADSVVDLDSTDDVGSAVAKAGWSR